MAFYRLVIGVLVVWRITHLFAYEAGPFRVLTRLRGFLRSRFTGEVLDCFYCLSFWVSIPLAFLTGETLTARLLLWPALSAGAIWVERFLPESGTPQAVYSEDSETDVL